MNAAQRHRGPDDEGIYADPERQVCLGATRLSIIDVAGGHQPLSNEDGTVWAVLNGEIYNHPALQQRLTAAGHTLRSRTDTEVLVHLYEEYGPDLVHALEGMYAFAIWDERARRLLIARDRFGEKPLFVSERGEDLDFASEVRSILPVLDGAEIDEDAVDAFFIFGYVPGPGSMYKGVRQLLPGHLLIWEEGRGIVSERRYWEPPHAATTATDAPGELTAETVRLLKISLQRTLLSDVPLGLFVSGGIDSGLIAALTREIMDEPPTTFSVGYDVGRVSEIAPARQLAEVLGAKHHEVVLTSAAVARDAPKVFGELGQPIADQAFLALHALACDAREHVTVAIGGHGADELFGGYPRYRWIRRAELVQERVPHRVSTLAAEALSHASSRRLRRLGDVADPRSTVERHLDWVTGGRRHLRASIYGPRLEHLAHSDRAIEDLRPHIQSGLAGGDAQRLMRLDQQHWLPDDVLFMADRSTMLASLELRTPFLSRELAEFAASVPARVHEGISGKSLLRAALSRYVPRSMVLRRKVAFRAPGAEWLRGPLSSVLDEQVLQGRLCTDGWCSPEALSGLIRAHRAGEDNTATLWPLMTLGLWLEGRPA
jgi:asparagine synthase (glutamine-hydrolysing)